jgi:predicted esterase
MTRIKVRLDKISFGFVEGVIVARVTQLLLSVLMVMSAGAIPLSLPSDRPLVRATTNPIVCKIWHNVPGAQITDTLATADLSRKPDEVRSLDKMEFAPDFKDAWAGSLTGLITVPKSGAYWFNIASRDSGVLFLSSDETAAHLKFIAETPAGTNIHDYKYYSAQTSGGVRLIAGQKYLIQAMVKCGPGPGCVSIAWHMTGGAFEGPIPNARFFPATVDVPPLNLRIKNFKLSLKPQTDPTTQPGIHTFVKGAEIELNGEETDMSYLMYLPKNFDTTKDAKPMLVFLHGNNMQGYTLEGTERMGPIHNLLTSTPLRDWMPMIEMCPQLPPDWRWDTPGAAQAVNGLVEQLCERYPRIDRKRIYLTGLSMGGKGTWLTLENSPQTYAAVVPISAVDVRPDLAPEELKNLPYLHIACGSEDGGFTAGSHRMYEALKPALGDRVQLTVFEHEGHGVWNHFYADQSFYEGLMKFSR